MCHICEDILCGEELIGLRINQTNIGLRINQTNITKKKSQKKSTYCHEQIQGMDYDFLPINTPTVSDTPFAVGGKHRNDFGSAERVCVMLTAGACRDVNPIDKNPKPKYEECRLRCWGSNFLKTTPKPKVRFNDTYSNYHPLYSVWEYPKGTQDPRGDPDDLIYQPQVSCCHVPLIVLFLIPAFMFVRTQVRELRPITLILVFRVFVGQDENGRWYRSKRVERWATGRSNLRSAPWHCRRPRRQHLRRGHTQPRYPKS